MPALSQYKISFRGFTLLELMITISIIAIISAVGVTTFSQSQKLGRDSRRKSDLRSIAIALELFYQKNSSRYPCSSVAGWVASNAAGWLTDSNGCTGGTNTSIAPTYINTMPKDPLANTADPKLLNNFGYAYYSINASAGTTPCPQGTYFILVTQLENGNDPERLSAKNVPFCGGTIAPGATTYGTFINNNFVLVAP